MSGERERKWTCAQARVPQVARFLAGRLSPDRAHAAGWVNSVYYDTPDRRFLREKLDSDFRKTKVRVRWYEDDDGALLSPDAYLEVKSKRGSSRTKTRLEVPLGAAEIRRLPFSDARLRALPDLARRSGEHLPSPLIPVLVVRYRRRRFFDPVTRSRVCLDDRIQTGTTRRAQSAGARLDQAVVEVKGPHWDLPEHLVHLYRLGCRSEAFSKYFTCHLLLHSSP